MVNGVGDPVVGAFVGDGVVGTSVGKGVGFLVGGGVIKFLKRLWKVLLLILLVQREK